MLEKLIKLWKSLQGLVLRCRIALAERKVRAAYDRYLQSFEIHINADHAMKRELPLETRKAKSDFNRALTDLMRLDQNTRWKFLT